VLALNTFWIDVYAFNYLSNFKRINFGENLFIFPFITTNEQNELCIIIAYLSET